MDADDDAAAEPEPLAPPSRDTGADVDEHVIHVSKREYNGGRGGHQQGPDWGFVTEGRR